MSKIFNSTGHELLIPNVVESEGIYLTDDKGKRYMDLESGVWCTSVGHANSRVNDTIKKQIDAVMHAGFCYSSAVLEEAAEAVLSITGFEGGKCVFLSSGSEAIEYARQAAKNISGNPVSMTLHDSYLGAFRSVTDRSKEWFLLDWQQCADCPVKDNCKLECEVLKNIPENLSEFLLEPGSSSGFVRFPPESMIRNVVDAVRANGGKIIANEVTTGIGRTGKWFGYNHYDLIPDMVTMGKGIGNGYPVSAVAINKETSAELENNLFKYNQSHQNDPLGAAIVSKVIEVIKDHALIEKAADKGAKFLEQLQSLEDGEIITGVRGRGIMFAVDICDETTCDVLFKKLIDKGFIVCNRKTSFRIDPSLIISEEEFDTFILAFRDLLNSMKHDSL